MGLTYVWDTNTVIYYLQNQLTPDGEIFLDDIAVNYAPVISVITEIELMCWKLASERDIILINNFISRSKVYELDENIKQKSIAIRRDFGLKLPDAIIAASAFKEDHILISRNFKDFKKIASLRVSRSF